MFNLSGYNTERLVVDYSVSMFNLSDYGKIPIINNTIKIYCNGIILTKAGSKIQGIVVNTIKVKLHR